MSVRRTTPSGHGEVLTEPAYREWRALAEENAGSAAKWRFDVAGMSVIELRDRTRREALEVARAFCERLGVKAVDVPEDFDLIAVTGHQPQLYHPGVWAKDFLIQRFADETGAVALDLVVDTDSFEDVTLHVPCLQPEVSVCSRPLSFGGSSTCYLHAPVPSADEIDLFAEEGARALATLEATAPRRHFQRFCEDIRDAALRATNLAELVTAARRRYEADTDYLELPVSELCATRAYLLFVTDIVMRADEFADAYNAELAEYRAEHRTRSAVQPFPNLAVDGDSTELPFWYIGDAERGPLWVARGEGEPELWSGGQRLAALPANASSDEVVDILAGLSGTIAPKALALTTHARMFLGDLFVHGVGGGRYDRVTDGVIERFYGVEAPGFAVASMTMYLPHGIALVTDEDVREAEARVHRLKHNPDEAMGDVEWDDPEQHRIARGLVDEKTSLVAEISQPDADRKSLGLRIRELNDRMLDLLAPQFAELEREVLHLREQQQASAVLTDRTYPFCLWSPEEVRDKLL